jgi:hypothetical protein
LLCHSCSYESSRGEVNNMSAVDTIRGAVNDVVDFGLGLGDRSAKLVNSLVGAFGMGLLLVLLAVALPVAPWALVAAGIVAVGGLVLPDLRKVEPAALFGLVALALSGWLFWVALVAAVAALWVVVRPAAD